MPEKAEAKKRSTKKVAKKSTTKTTKKSSKKAATKAPVKKAVAKAPAKKAVAKAPAKKATAKKAVAKKSSAVKKKGKSVVGAKPEVESAKWMSQAERHQLISVAAYYRGLERGEQWGGPEGDWLAAESQIDAELAKAGIALRA